MNLHSIKAGYVPSTKRLSFAESLKNFIMEIGIINKYSNKKDYFPALRNSLCKSDFTPFRKKADVEYNCEYKVTKVTKFNPATELPEWARNVLNRDALGKHFDLNQQPARPVISSPSQASELGKS